VKLVADPLSSADLNGVLKEAGFKGEEEEGLG